MFTPPREVQADYEQPHLRYTNMGDGINPAHLCYSSVGRTHSSGRSSGQVVNLGSPGCLRVGTILKMTLQSLGLSNSTTELSLIDKIELARVYQQVTGGNKFRSKFYLFLSQKKTASTMPPLLRMN